MTKNPLLFLCALALMVPVPAGADDVRVIKSFEYQGLDGPVRLQNGRVVFSHLDAGGNAHNAVLLDPADGNSRSVVEGVPGARFVAEDERYLIYSSFGGVANTLAVRSKRGNELVASTELRRGIQWGHIDKDRLIVALAGAPHAAGMSVLVYSLPSLQLEKSADITGGNDTALWGNKIVSIGLSLGIYGLDLNKVAVVEIPPPPGRSACGGGPLRIAGDKAVVGTGCGQLVVVDLPSARVERAIPAGSSAPSFDVSEGVIFAVAPDAATRDVQAIDLASGIELARLPIDADFLALRGNRLLGMKKGNRFGAPVQFTLYELELATLKSETVRMARVKEGCEAAERALGGNGDLHAAIEACEKSGIKSFLQGPRFAPELLDVTGAYAVWLARSHSRYDEGISLLERLVPAQASEQYAAELATARRKASYLDPPAKDTFPTASTKYQNPPAKDTSATASTNYQDPPAKDAPPTASAEPPGVTSVPVDLGGHANVIAFEGDRIYIGRWLCNGKPKGYPGVVLDALDRKTLQVIKQIDIASCDFGQGDGITSIAVMQGYVVLGMTSRRPRPDRPNMVVVDAKTLAVKARGFIGMNLGLRNWRGTLLACGPRPGRFDPESVSLMELSRAEARACATGGPELKSPVMASSTIPPVLETARFRAELLQGGQEFSYKITGLRNPEKIFASLKPRSYMELFPLSERDALVMAYANGPYRRFMLYEIATQDESVLFELNASGRPVVSAVWGDFLFVALERDLLVYDLKRRITVKYEQDFIREGQGPDRRGVKRFLIDEDRLLASTLDNANSRVVDLDVYLTGLPAKDFFAP